MNRPHPQPHQGRRAGASIPTSRHKHATMRTREHANTRTREHEAMAGERERALGWSGWGGLPHRDRVQSMAVRPSRHGMRWIACGVAMEDRVGCRGFKPVWGVVHRLLSASGSPCLRGWRVVTGAAIEGADVHKLGYGRGGWRAEQASRPAGRATIRDPRSPQPLPTHLYSAASVLGLPLGRASWGRRVLV